MRTAFFILALMMLLSSWRATIPTGGGGGGKGGAPPVPCSTSLTSNGCGQPPLLRPLRVVR